MSRALGRELGDICDEFRAISGRNLDKAKYDSRRRRADIIPESRSMTLAYKDTSRIRLRTGYHKRASRTTVTTGVMH
jgi:hypothetical protein